jgi:N6-adenosine-specific RNA methylase IME4
MLDHAARQELKRARRAQREQELAAATIAASKELGREVFSVIVADPPWSFEPYSRSTGMDRAADNHYPTMRLDQIKALPIPAAKDAVLFLWTTGPMLPQALDVMDAWGFKYKSHFVWVKDRVGTGYWARNQHELLLIGTRGHVPCPAPGTQPSSVVSAPRGRHSEKPAIVRTMIAEMFPNLPKIELFARGQHAGGWSYWGNET